MDRQAVYTTDKRAFYLHSIYILSASSCITM